LRDANVEAVVETLIHRTISFECPIATTSDADISWTKDDVPLFPGLDDHIQILNAGRQLVISGVQRYDQAIYTCVARNKAGEAYKNYKLVVLVPPAIVGTGGQFKVIENNSLILPCEVEGQPFPAITWTKDGKPALQLRSVQALSEGQQLKIVSAARQHRGSYMCSAENKVGKAEITFDVDVISKFQRMCFI
uniref:Ig-like domain-containing protein n=1 Tax=Gongylonema pulchrum TaxID=637853 RepID=A0A183D1U6_9BILA